MRLGHVHINEHYFMAPNGSLDHAIVLLVYSFDKEYIACCGVRMLGWALSCIYDGEFSVMSSAGSTAGSCVSIGTSVRRCLERLTELSVHSMP